MKERELRTAYLLGEENIEKLHNSHVAVFGVGGVGGYAVEALARAGVGSLTLVDGDVVAESNINRQIIADYETLGKPKTDAFCERIARINPDARVYPINKFVLSEDIASFDFSRFDYVIDAIDTVSAKLAIVEECKRLGVAVISSMGTGNKLNPTELCAEDIYKTSVCPLARVMRRELKKRGVASLKVVYSREEPRMRAYSDGSEAVGSVSFVPSVAGLIIASEVIKDLTAVK